MACEVNAAMLTGLRGPMVWLVAPRAGLVLSAALVTDCCTMLLTKLALTVPLAFSSGVPALVFTMVAKALATSL